MADSPAAQQSSLKSDTSFDEIFNGGSAAGNGITSSSEKKSNIFSRDTLDLNFLDTSNPNAKPLDSSLPTGAAGAQPVSQETNPSKVLPDEGSTIDDLIGETEDLLSTAPGSGNSGKHKPDHSGLNDFFKKQIEGGRLFTFDDFDDKKQSLDDYLGSLSQKDFEELWDANHNEFERKTHHSLSENFFNSLPTELQYAYKYVSDGGNDLKGLFKSLAQTQETRELSIEKPEDHEPIYRQYLSAINFGSSDEIDEEIRTWKDLGQLDKKAKQAKPKLDKLQEQIVTRQMEHQESIRKQNEQAAQAYVENVFAALEPGTINGLKLDKKTQAFLYNSMVSAQYPSITGKPTNLLGHLLEKYQYLEPNYSLLSEALWLLSDPEGYRTKLIETGATQHAAKTVRALKTEESRKNVGDQQQQTQSDNTGKGIPGRVPRQVNIFRRN
jgi:hypothetical protein